MALVIVQGFDALRVEQGGMAFVDIQLGAIGQPCPDRMLEHHHAGGVGFLADQKTCTQCTHVALGTAHVQRARGVGGNLNQQAALTQDQQALLRVELQVDRAAGIEAQTTTVGQGEVAPLTTTGAQIGQQRFAHLAARAQPQAAAEHTEGGNAAQQIAARSCRLQQHPARFPGLARGPAVEAAYRLAGAAEALLQAFPGLRVSGVTGKPQVELRLQCSVGVAGAQAHHPVDGAFGGRVQARLLHGASSLR
ncbi:hypothetical protein D3C80_919260 [compost metagenome]